MPTFCEWLSISLSQNHMPQVMAFHFDDSSGVGKMFCDDSSGVSNLFYSYATSYGISLGCSQSTWPIGGGVLIYKHNRRVPRVRHSLKQNATSYGRKVGYDNKTSMG